MRWAKIEWQGEIGYGIVEGDRIALVEGGLFDGAVRTGESAPLEEVTFQVPLIPRTFYAAGMNYVDHVIEQAKIAGREPDIPDKPDIGYRANNALIAHNEAIVKPKDAGERFQYEGELVVVIGKQAKHLTEANALSCVLGYTIGNDVCERDWQSVDRSMWRCKNSDTFKPMGPWIETDVELDKLRTQVRVNGEVKSDFPTNKMIFGVEHYISVMTQHLTLIPGDMIWMGTDGATPNMVPGDVCDVEIEGIGVLSNPVVLEE